MGTNSKQTPRGSSRQARPRRIGRALLPICCATWLGGCATPPAFVRWPEAPQAMQESAHTLDKGRSYANQVRKSYEDAVAKFVEGQTHSANGLLGLGALATLLMASNAHKDAYLGTAFVGGTGYAYANMNLSSQRANIHMKAIEAIQCAKLAVSPLGMYEKDRQALHQALEDLTRSIHGVRDAQAELRDAVKNSPSEKTRVDGFLASADAAVEEAVKARSAGQKLYVSSGLASDRMIEAVDNIHIQVQQTALKAIPDLASVTPVIAGLASFANAFVPGVDVAAYIGTRRSAPTASLSGGKNISAPPAQNQIRSKLSALSVLDTDVEKAANGLLKQVDLLQVSTVQVLAQYAHADGALKPDALKACGIGDIPFPLQVKEAKQRFKAGMAASKTVVVSGGVQPYVVIAQDGAPKGVVVTQPRPFDSLIQIAIGNDAEATPLPLTYLVMDAAKPPNTQAISLEIVKP